MKENEIVRILIIIICIIAIGSCGKDFTFTSGKKNKVKLAEITTDTLSSITHNSAISGGNIIDDGGGEIKERGVVWSLSQAPVLEFSSHTIDGSGKGRFTSQISDLLPDTVYYVRAYASNSAGTSYASERSFRTLPLSSKTLPIVATLQATAITENSAVSGGIISSDGGTAILNKGVVWDTSINPDISISTKTNQGGGTGDFSSILTDLKSYFSYYLRAYATNEKGTAYGEQIIFKTLPASGPTLAVISTSSITDISDKGAVGGGYVSSDGGSSVTSRGVVWSINKNPTVNLPTKTNDGQGQGGFTSNISGLQDDTEYFIRAYATNIIGTAYGDELSFRTLKSAEIIVPELTTTSISSITQNTAMTGGNITNSGGTPVLSRGVVWSVNPNPTISLSSKTLSGTGSGSFISFIINLQAGTTYYVRAYATNSAGTGYGNELSFTTLSGLTYENENIGNSEAPGIDLETDKP